MAYSRNRMFFGFSTMVMLCLALYIAQRLLWNVPFSLWEKWGFFILILVIVTGCKDDRILKNDNITMNWVKEDAFILLNVEPGAVKGIISNKNIEHIILK